MQMNGSCGRICSSTCTIFGLVLILFVVKDYPIRMYFWFHVQCICCMYSRTKYHDPLSWWWFQFFWGEDEPILTSVFFSDGLVQPPTSHDPLLLCQICLFQKTSAKNPPKNAAIFGQRWLQPGIPLKTWIASAMSFWAQKEELFLAKILG